MLQCLENLLPLLLHGLHVSVYRAVSDFSHSSLSQLLCSIFALSQIRFPTGAAILVERLHHALWWVYWNWLEPEVSSCFSAPPATT